MDHVTSCFRFLGSFLMTVLNIILFQDRKNWQTMGQETCQEFFHIFVVLQFSLTIRIRFLYLKIRQRKAQKWADVENGVEKDRAMVPPSPRRTPVEQPQRSLMPVRRRVYRALQVEIGSNLGDQLKDPVALRLYGGQRDDWSLKCCKGVSQLILGDSQLKKGARLILSV